MCERIESVPAERVLVRDLVDFIIGNAVEDGTEFLGRVGPHRVGVGIVHLPCDVLDADLVSELDADRIGDEAGQEVFAEDVARQPVAEVLARPEVVHVIGPVDPFEEVGDPAGPSL